MTSAFSEFAILLSLSVVVGWIAINLRQPVIFSFIIVGIIAGPGFFDWISAHSELETLASFGVMFLLFIVGLKLDVQVIKTLGSATLILGAAQIGLTTLLGWLLGFAFGMTQASALLVAIALTFSSTVIIIKILSDRYETDSLYGRLSIGILILQDLVAVIAIIILSALNVSAGAYSQLQWEIAALIIKGVGFLAAIGFLMRFIIPYMLEQMAKSRELLVLFAVAWAVVLAVIASTLGFSQEVGGFLAGVSLASTRYREAIASRLETLRNLLLLFFFLNLGASLELGSLANQVFPAIIFSLFVLIGKPLIVMTVMSIMRFRKRTGFLTGLTLGQISEFSLILAALGEGLGFLDKNAAGLITFVALITISLSTYIIAYAGILYEWLTPWLNLFERNVKYREDTYALNHQPPVDVIIYGFGRHGEHMARELVKHGLTILAVDFDPRRIRAWQHEAVLIRYGDAEDGEFIKTLPLSAAKWIVSTIAHHDSNQVLLSSLKDVGYQGKIALSAYQENEVAWMEKAGVDMILIPYKDAASAAADRILEQIFQRELRFT
ncbi:cation:proton antiporter [Aquicella lusitana]|uniref:Transporter (CPA2 family) n=1 Tax=Aquicella lusitana TaxID=254246 RepID=A0A370GMS0_9COXI|nr:cation:proton antiporter family protein [Aquicella lusitana]RDI44576.1 transporter (CPA2 family) [Aquicella lusitana]VVC72482.1 Glutathione-regulated potassium-efflux system protein KefC [Aquicella lusitana]